MIEQVYLVLTAKTILPTLASAIFGSGSAASIDRCGSADVGKWRRSVSLRVRRSIGAAPDPTKEIKMNEQNHFNITGLASGSILALIVAMAISLVFDLQPAEARARTTAVHTASVHA